MNHYDSFIFDSYDFDPSSGEIRLRYSLDNDIHFEETLTIPVGDRPVTDAALQALHLAGGVSYYKTCCPNNIVIRWGELSHDQAAFWNTVYEKGLGEFFYENTIDFRGLINFPSTDTQPAAPAKPHGHTGKTLIPIGGGKDSVVTVETVRKDETKNITLLRMGRHPLIDEVIAVTGMQCIVVDRTLDPQLFALNEQGALNGHIPISAYLSALAVVVAESQGFDEIVMSNEKSANIGNVEYLGAEINHQWSKSEEFETMFNTYITAFIDPDLRYFSALRSMTELEIAGEFAKYPQYFHCTTSCNRNWKIAGERQEERWCGTCPKCTFVFALMAAHLKKETVLSMFEKNIFADASTIPLFKQLLGREGFKPFECVGTPEETREAFSMIKERGEFDDTPVMQMYTDELQ